MINRLWEWVKGMFGRLFRRKHDVAISPETHKQKPRDEASRRINPSFGGPNMPKRQPCPECRLMAKRKRKTVGGAYYYCRRCKNSNFVRGR